MNEAKHIFLRHISALVPKLEQDLEESGNEPLSVTLRERILTLLSVLLQEEAPHDWPAIRTLSLLVAPKMEQAGYRDEWASYLDRALLISKRVGDIDGEGALALELGILHQLRGRWSPAKQHLNTSATIYLSLGKNQTYAGILNRLGFIARQQGYLSQAEEYAHQALELLQEKDGERHFSLFILGAVESDKLQWSKAESYYRQSLEICQRSGDVRNEARRHRDIGLTLDAQDRLRNARIAYEQAIEMFDKIDDRVELAVTQMNLGIIYSKLGQHRKALDFYVEAEQVFHDVQDELQLGYLLNNKGVDYQEIKRFPESEAAYKAAIEFFTRVGSSLLLIQAQINCGELYIQTRCYRQAQAIFQDALHCVANIEDPSLVKHYKSKIEMHLKKLLES